MTGMLRGYALGVAVALAIATPARADDQPSSLTTSSAFSTIFAPSRSRAWPPVFLPLSTFPGTTMTSRPCSNAHEAVMSDPDFSEASMTTTP